MTNKTYNCSQARITADKGETMKADIMEIGHEYAEGLQRMREQMLSDYWRLHKEVSETAFKYSGEQIAALEKLGQLGIALKKIDAAHSAVVSVKCW